MTKKPAFLALGAPMSPAWMRGSRRVEEAALPKSVESSYISVNKAVIRWMVQRRSVSHDRIGISHRTATEIVVTKLSGVYHREWREP